MAVSEELAVSVLKSHHAKADCLFLELFGFLSRSSIKCSFFKITVHLDNKTNLDGSSEINRDINLRAKVCITLVVLGEKIYKLKCMPYIHPVDIFTSESLSTQPVCCRKVRVFLYAGGIL